MQTVSWTKFLSMMHTGHMYYVRGTRKGQAFISRLYRKKQVFYIDNETKEVPQHEAEGVQMETGDYIYVPNIFDEPEEEAKLMRPARQELFGVNEKDSGNVQVQEEYHDTEGDTTCCQQ